MSSHLLCHVHIYVLAKMLLFSKSMRQLISSFCILFHKLILFLDKSSANKFYEDRNHTLLITCMHFFLCSFIFYTVILTVWREITQKKTLTNFWHEECIHWADWNSLMDGQPKWLQSSLWFLENEKKNILLP